MNLKKTSKMVSVPRTLTDLIDGFIESLKGQYEDVYENLDTLIAKDRWMKKFQEYLQNRDLDEEVQKLHFVVLAQMVFKYQNLINGDKDKNSANQKEKLKREQRDLFNYIIRTFFSEDPISLSNQKLIEKLSDYADTRNITTEMIDHLKKAQKDSDVWFDCLEKDYTKFQKQTNTTRSAMAYLLSIL